MNYHELIQTYFERSVALQWYWTLYVIIIGGLMAYSSFRQRKDLIKTVLVTVLFSFFAYKNLDAIHDVTRERFATLGLIKESAPTGPEAADVKRVRELLDPTLDLATPEWEGVWNFHVVSDLLTIVTLWAMERRRKKVA